MIFYDGIYRLKARGYLAAEGFDRHPCAWRLRAIDFSTGRPEVIHLRPFAAVAVPLCDGEFAGSCLESLGRRIFADLDLDIRKTLWIECFSDLPRQVYVARFEQKTFSGPELSYAVTWRGIRPNEIEAVAPFIPEFAQSVCLL